MINQPVSFSLDSLLIKKLRSIEVDETGTDRISQATGDNLQSIHIHCNNQMQTDWLVKALQLNITIIIFKEVVNGYDPFSTIFLMLLQMVKVSLLLSHLRKPFSIWSIYSFSSNSSSYLLYTFIVLVLVLSLRKILVPVPGLVLRQNTVLQVPELELK